MTVQPGPATSSGISDQRFYSIRAFACLLASIVIFVAMYFLGYFLEANNTILFGDAQFMTGWKYSSGTDLSNLFHHDDEAVPIASLSQMRAYSDNDYIKLVGTLNPSAKPRTIVMNTYLNQVLVRIDREKILDTIDETQVFSNQMRQIITLEPSDVREPIEVIMRVSLFPRLEATITDVQPYNKAPVSFLAGVLFLFAAVTAILSVVSIGVGFSMSTFGTKAKLLPMGISSLLFFIFLLFLWVYSYFDLSGLWLLRIAFGFAMLSAIVLFYGFIQTHRIESPILSGILSAGILYVAVYLIADHNLFALALLKAFPYYLGVVFLICIIESFRKAYKLKARWSYVASLDLVCFSAVMFWVLGMQAGGALIVPVIVLAMFQHSVFVLGQELMSEHQVNRVREASAHDDSWKMAYRPDNLGSIEKLFEIFMQNPANFTHVRNVSLYVYEICFQSGMSREESTTVAKASFLHDIGKIMVPLRTVSKDSVLSEEEYEQMKMHAQFGYEILSSSSDEFLLTAAVIAKQHHERFDGNGYYGMVGEAIHPYAQIVCIADVFEATTAARKYKESWSFDEGYEYILAHSGIYFSPVYVEAFKKCRTEIHNIYNRIKETQS